MTTCYIDSNILISYKNDESIFYKQASDILNFLLEQKIGFAISSLVIDEFLFSVQYFLRKKKQFNFGLLKQVLVEIMSLPNLVIIEAPTHYQTQITVIDLIQLYNLKPRDAYHLLIMKEHAIDYFATFDSDFERVFAQGVIQRIPSFKKIDP